MKKLDSRDQLADVNIGIKTQLNPRRIESQKSWERDTTSKSCCTHICETLPLVCSNFKSKLSDHLLLGGEHIKKVSPG